MLMFYYGAGGVSLRRTVLTLIHRKIPGVPIVSVAKGKYVIERLPDAPDSR